MLSSNKKDGNTGLLPENDKSKEFFSRLLCSVKKHKAVTIMTAVVLLVAIAATVTVNHYLSMINYVGLDDELVPVYTGTADEKSVSIEQTQQAVSPLVKNPDGTYTLPDGRVVVRGEVSWQVGDNTVFYDGSYLTEDGKAVLSDGTTIYDDSTVVFPDGSFLKNASVTVSEDGYATFINGEVAHITGFSIAKDGTVTAKQSLFNLHSYPQSGVWSVYKSEVTSQYEYTKAGGGLFNI